LRRTVTSAIVAVFALDIVKTGLKTEWVFPRFVAVIEGKENGYVFVQPSHPSHAVEAKCYVKLTSLKLSS
jgi:hypothetical protein